MKITTTVVYQRLLSYLYIICLIVRLFELVRRLIITEWFSLAKMLASLKFILSVFSFLFLFFLVKGSQSA